VGSEEHGSVERHYTLEDLEGRVFEALRRAGLDVDALSPDDLAPLDEFHIRGREATDELAALAPIASGEQVLDVGCGLGGTARHLAARYGARVTGVDLTAEYCRVGNLLNELTGLAGQIELARGDALQLPFKDGCFDAVWTEHAAMNIADKAGLYRELRRVLHSGGRLALYDVVKGTGGDLWFPVPWARHPELSFLVTADELNVLLESHGFTIEASRDVTLPAVEWYRELAASLGAGERPSLGFHVLLGSDAKEMFANGARNLQEDRIRLVQVVAEAT
jgi:SAM-dependent methyltransferase